MKLFRALLPFIFLSLTFLSCTEKAKETTSSLENTKESSKELVRHANGFSLEKNNGFTILKISNPWPNSDREFTYALVPKRNLATITLPSDAYDAIIPVPIHDLVVTSTTHIPALESLTSLERLKGFPDTQYISSNKARSFIEQGKIKELGRNESLNTELVLEMQPDLVVGFAIDNQNPVYQTIQNAKIPVVYNGDWTEHTPLGKAEWIKFFGALLGKGEEASEIFDQIETSYLEIKNIAKKASSSPTVLSGALYKDVWYLPAGESWASQFLRDANANYLWSDSKGTGSLSLGLEAVLEKGQNADIWISPSQFTAYSAMQDASPHYSRFKAYKNHTVFSFASTKGATGGLLYYELAPQRPDLVLKDLVAIFHPDLLPNYEPHFFKPLQR